LEWEHLIVAEAIWKITGRIELVLPCLGQALDESNLTRKDLAIRVLAEIGPAAQPRIPK
jgi:hypothetical protein